MFSSDAARGSVSEEQIAEEQSRSRGSSAVNERAPTDESVEVVRTPSETIQILPSNGDPSVLENEGENASAPLTRRLRCLFSTVTWPIVPLGSIVALALAWLLYAAFVLDLRRSCSHPLHWYAAASLALVTYAPSHAHVRSLLFRYSRERDGPIRPRRVRMYDQLFHTMCLLYVYGGVTLLQACRDDELKNNESPVAPGSYEPNTCAVTCPNLHQALSVYVATLEMFTVALVLPLAFLPCIYLWILRRATEEMGAFAQLHDRLEEEEALLNGEGVTAQELMDSLECVKLVSRKDLDGARRTDLCVLSGYHSGGGNEASPRRDRANVKECCICMTEFDVHFEEDIHREDVESGLSDTMPLISHSNRSLTSMSGSQATNISHVHNMPAEKLVVRTRCGHMFHHRCLAGWIGGRWQQSQQGNSEETVRRRPRRTCCPLCREDLKPRTQYQSV